MLLPILLLLLKTAVVGTDAHCDSLYSVTVSNGPVPTGSKCAELWYWNQTRQWYTGCAAHTAYPGSAQPFNASSYLPQGGDRFCSLGSYYDSADPKIQLNYGFCACPVQETCNSNKNCPPGEYCEFASEPHGRVLHDGEGLCTSARCRGDGCLEWFDGCSTCSCGLDGKITGCQPKTCKKYGKPTCTKFADEKCINDYKVSIQKENDVVAAITTLFKTLSPANKAKVKALV